MLELGCPRQLSRIELAGGEDLHSEVSLDSNPGEHLGAMGGSSREGRALPHPTQPRAAAAADLIAHGRPNRYWLGLMDHNANTQCHQHNMKVANMDASGVMEIGPQLPGAP